MVNRLCRYCKCLTISEIYSSTLESLLIMLKSIVRLTLCVLLNFISIFNNQPFASTYNFQSFNFDNAYISNKVNSIIQDESGYIWLATDLGLNRFDGSKLKVYKNIKGDGTSLSDNFITDLKIGSSNDLWIATDNGLNRLDLANDKIIRYVYDKNNKNSLIHNQVKSIDIDSDNNIWIATKGGLAKLNTATNQFTNYVVTQGMKNTVVSNRLSPIKVDHNNNVWIGYEKEGLSYLDTTTGMFHHYAEELLHDEVSNLALDADNNLWLGYGLPGLSKFDHNTAQFSHMPMKEFLNRTEQISAIHTLKNGDIWFGTFKDGIFIKRAGKVDDYVAVNSSNLNVDGIAPTQITEIYQDRSDNIWLTTTTKGIYFISNNNLISNTLSKYSSEWNQLVDNTIWSVTEDSKQRIWVGSDSKGVQLFSAKNKSTLVFEHDANNNNSLSDNRVLDIIETRSGHIWLATSRGVNLFDEEKLQFKRFFYNDDDPLSSSVFSHLTEDNEGNIWAATFSAGVVRISKDFELDFFQQSEKEGAISSNAVTSMVVDRNGTLWVGTRSGLNSFNNETQRFTHHDLPINSIWSLAWDQHNEQLLVGTSDGLIIFNPNDKKLDLIDVDKGLVGSMVYCILQSNQKIILSTDQGISTIDSTQNVNNYSYLHGLQQGYNLNSCEKLDDETLYFGSDKGLSYFTEKALEKKALEPKSLISNFKVYDEGKGRYISQVMADDELQLPYLKNNLKIYFVGILFEQTTSLSFEYRLIGLNDNWSRQDSNEANVFSISNAEAIATYTNLSPGEYKFQVKFQSEEGNWSNVSNLKFKIFAPWWQTKTAYVSYCVLMLLAIFLIIKWQTKRINNERIILEKKVKVRTLELESMAIKAEQLALEKARLFANVSHEFKTPLTLILSPLEQLITKLEYESIKPTLTLIQNNANRLLHLVERLLSFSKIGEVDRTVSIWIDISKEMKKIIDSFQPIILNKKIKVEFTSLVDAKLKLIDDSFDTIFINLLSNALKFTEINGLISVKIYQLDNYLYISVIDTGVGISSNDIGKMFDYFSRGQLAIDNNIPGTGIGLALVQQLIKANDAELIVKSELGLGSEFTVKFAINQGDNSEKCAITKTDNINVEHEIIDILDCYTAFSSETDQRLSLSRSILIIDDNTEMSGFVKSLFENEFICYTAKNGELGVDIAQQELPDIIICDVMMPGISGFDVIKQIRDGELTCHIPIVMLTAKGDFESKQKGWQLQADEYLSKPFQTEDLINRIDNLLSIRRTLKKRFSVSIGGEITTNDTFGLTEKDLIFISKFENVIRENFRSPEFNRDLAAKELAMSERQLNRKLSALVGHNFSEYLRKFRLTYSLSLKSKGMQVAQVAEEVGFSSLSYFSTCFKAEFGKAYSKYSKT